MSYHLCQMNSVCFGMLRKIRSQKALCHKSFFKNKTYKILNTVFNHKTTSSREYLEITKQSKFSFRIAYNNTNFKETYKLF